MIGKTLRALGLSAAAIVAATFSVFAQSAPAPQADGAAAGKGRGPMAACRADMKALCATVERKGGGRMKCLVENKDKASAECQAVIASVKQRMGTGAMKEARKQARQACRADAQTLCATAAKGNGGVMRCLRDNEAKVSPACAQALASLPLRKRGAMQPTGGEGAASPVAPAPPSVTAAPPAKPKAP